MMRELGFYFGIAVAGWLCLGATVGGHRGRGPLSLAALGFVAGAWAVGDLMIIRADSPAEIALGRRVFFLGAAGLPPIWLWLSLNAALPKWFLDRPRRAAFAFIAPTLFYSCLYWDQSVRFVAWNTPKPEHGPWFHVFLVHQYVLVTLGTWYFAKAAVRLHRSNLATLAALSVGVALPLVVNFAYSQGWLLQDWTAAALGPAGILIWIALVDSGVSANLPVDRHEVIEQLDVGVVVADLEGRIVNANAATEKLLEHTDLRGRRLSDAVALAEQRPDAVIESRAIDLRGRRGIVGHALILTDRTEAESVRRRLELTGRLEALGSLTAGIAHEVNNPLSFIQANLSSLESTAKMLADDSIAERLTEEVAEAVADMACVVEETQEGVERIRLLVQRLGNFSRSPDVGASVHSIDLGATLGQAVAVASIGFKGEPIAVELECDPHLAIRESAVFQILVNLMLNAVQAAPEQAEIRVRVEDVDGGVAISVRDNGPGIPPALLPRLFDPFFTTKPTGTGLGLSLSFDLANQIGGRLEAANREEGGAVFTLWLPRTPAAIEGVELGDCDSHSTIEPCSGSTESCA